MSFCHGFVIKPSTVFFFHILPSHLPLHFIPYTVQAFPLFWFERIKKIYTNKHVKGWRLSVCVSTHGPRAFGCTGRCCGLRLRPVCRPALGRCSWWTSPALAAPPAHVWWWYSASLPILEEEEEEEDRRGKLYLNSSLPNLVDRQHISYKKTFIQH